MADQTTATVEESAAAPPPARGPFSPFRYPAFRAIWTANLASNLGSSVQSVAAAWLMTDLTKSHGLIALVQASSILPILLFGVFAGAIADNYDRRLVMLGAQIGMLIVSTALALMTWFDLITPYVLLAFTLAVGIGSALNSPAWQASVRQQVGLADLPQAISLNTISFNLGRSVGPAIGGMLISLWNVSLAFVVNALSYIALIVVLLRWKPDTVRVEPKPMLAAIAVGLRFCAGSSPIRRVLIRGVTMGFGVSCFMALMPAVVRDRLHGTEIDFGMLLGLFGIGSILGALFMPIARRRFGVEKVLAAGSLFFIVAETVMGEVSNVYFALPATFIAGLGWVAVLTTLNTAIQMRSPQNIMGRCLSIYQAATFGAMALGSWSWGMAADWTDLPTTLHASSVFILTMSIVLRLVAPMPKPSEGRVDS